MARARRDAPRRYVMLVVSLPHPGDLSVQERMPLSRPKLERRLGLLEATDRATLAAVERVVQWDAIDNRLSDPEMAERAASVLAMLAAARLDDLHDAVRHRLEMRTVVAALRRRHLGGEPPGPDEAPWGFGRYTARIAANWQRRDLGLGRVFGWIGEAQDLLVADDPRGLEWLLLGHVWRDLARRAERHRFDFTAVALYVLRWNILDRWTRMDAREAEARFDALIADALASLDDPLAAEPARG